LTPHPPTSSAHRLFTRYGIELEYMIVEERTLDVMPAADRLLSPAADSLAAEAVLDEVAWSNELVLHVIEMKVREPASSLSELAEVFDRSVRRANKLLMPLGGRLMPSGAHPWMHPEREARLWPHEDAEIYREFDRIFGCRTHGWTNLQSMHINLGFGNDEDFARLHAAIRLLMPVIPALAASTPFLDAAPTGRLDSRLEAYRSNAQKVPFVAGKVIPEPIFSPRAYREQILERLYKEMAPYDARGVLRYEWLNARGAIPRFERDTIEIRVIDMQECPKADLAVAAAVVGVLQALARETWCSLAEQRAWAIAPLRKILFDVIRDGDAAVIDHEAYLVALGYSSGGSCQARALWEHLVETTQPAANHVQPVLEQMLQHGCLARRLLRAAGARPSRERLREVYAELCSCLADNRLFLP